MLLKQLFKSKMESKVPTYLALVGRTFDDKDVDNLIEHFRDQDRRKEFFKEYKEIEMLYEIISPDAFLRPFIDQYATLSSIYAVVRNAYAKTVYVDRAFQKKTRSGRALLDMRSQERVPEEATIQTVVEKLQTDILTRPARCGGPMTPSGEKHYAPRRLPPSAPRVIDAHPLQPPLKSWRPSGNSERARTGQRTPFCDAHHIFRVRHVIHSRQPNLGSRRTTPNEEKLSLLCS